MCEPVTAALSGGSTLLNLAGAITGAQDAKVQADEEALALDENAKLARRAAVDAIYRGEREGAARRGEATKIVAQQAALFGASGIDGSTGSAAALAADSRVQAELDAKLLRHNAKNEAYGLRRQAYDLRRQARRTRERGQKEGEGSLLGGLGGFASGATEFGTRYK